MVVGDIDCAPLPVAGALAHCVPLPAADCSPLPVTGALAHWVLVAEGEDEMTALGDSVVEALAGCVPLPVADKESDTLALPEALAQKVPPADFDGGAVLVAATATAASLDAYNDAMLSPRNVRSSAPPSSQSVELRTPLDEKDDGISCVTFEKSTQSPATTGNLEENADTRAAELPKA